MGQIEVDEVYVGVSTAGAQFVVPVQAKVNRDRHSVVQTIQDHAFCSERFPSLTTRCVSIHFDRESDQIALFELVVNGRQVQIRDERHYRLVDADQLSQAEIESYRSL